MPKITQDYETRKPGPTPGMKYPIEKWLGELQARTKDWSKKGSKGKQPTLEVTQGVDFEITPASMAEYIWKYRRDNELPLRLSIQNNSVLIFWEGKR